MTAADAGTAIIVFARAPTPGAVKTRLIPLLGAEGAAGLHARLVKQTLSTARAAAFHRIELHGAPGIDDPFFRLCAGHFAVALLAQAGGNLGERMFAALKSALAVHPRVLLLGSDCPALTAEHLRKADRSLRDGTDAVLVPCEDGGYALIGLARVDARLFDGVPWGGETVMAETRARLRELGWRWCELETLWDVDRPEDYQRLLACGLLDDRLALA
jgi:rSAM/selenodomain-associated transferase 1